jgi:hypothetical protein
MTRAGVSSMGLALLLAAPLAGPTRADPAAPPPAAPTVRTFSSLCSDAESGDFRGLRITMEGEGGAGLSLTLEEPGGAVLASTSTKDVTFAPATGHLSFRLQDDAGPVAFEGTMSATTLDGTLVREDGTREAVHLPEDKGRDSDAACRVAPDSGKP